jgi:type IV pilus assembly protein PilB
MKLTSASRTAPDDAARVALIDRAQPRPPVDLQIQPGGVRLGELLVAAGMVTLDQMAAVLQAAMAGPPRFLGEYLIERGLVSEAALTATVGRQRGLHLVDLRDVQPQPSATSLLTEADARALLAIPLTVHDQFVEVAIAVPVDGLPAKLVALIGRPVLLSLATRSDILRAIGSSYRALAGVDSELRAFAAQYTIRPEAARTDAAAAADDAPVVRVVQLIITQALRDRASDIHIEPHPDGVRVRFRIDGALHDVQQLPEAMGPAVVSRIKIMAGLNIVERRRPQDGQISLDIEGRSVDIRVSTTAVIEGEKVVLRLLDKSRQLFGLTELGMPDDMVGRYTSVLKAPYGMLICAGPTGSGKTTTLYGSLSQINSPELNVMTIEDPVEYRIPATNQIQINEQAGITFAGGLRSILRQDPDVILVGEIRDAETARIAVQAALTGHFVLSSLHATDSPAALHRLLDMNIEGFLIASSVTAVVTQRLVRRSCPHCLEPYQPSADELGFLRSINGIPPRQGFLRGRGCNFCAHTGFLERVGVFELMPISERIRELIVERGAHDQIRKVARAEGMRTLQEEAARLVEAGTTTVAEVLRSIYVVGN